jgi:hypothetical protein
LPLNTLDQLSKEHHDAKANPSSDAWTQRPADRTSQTDDERIKDITVLPLLNT